MSKNFTNTVFYGQGSYSDLGFCFSAFFSPVHMKISSTGF